MVKTYQIVLHEITLEAEIKPYEDGLEPLYSDIQCSTIDHTSAIDILRDSNIDIWLDDEGLLKERPPVFVFIDSYGLFTGALVGNLVFQKHDNDGNSYGLTKEEADTIVEWIEGHYKITVSDEELGEYQSYVIDPRETEKHRRDIEAMKKWALDNGFHII